ncbi:hypothetical protein [Sporomusa malonica]|uniref:Uncharacterized protein n=1 Tax=Sporomusa malonica TaxID=112901 RepID=A0A1W2ECQ3_9FIRM|nr:hypothetical protein [Sporomusa malonica]SMD07530.1 hypothetical protein SAMN04488500_12329 [Sporomusa malonica]
MGKNSIKRRQLRLKFKRRAAALMGAAIMTGAALSGIPVTKALAAEAPSNPYPTKVEQTVQVTKDARLSGHGWHQHKYSWPSPDENQAWVQDGKIYYRSDNNDRHHYNDYARYVNSPVDYVKDSAARYGFNASLDSFSLLTVSSQRALVEVRQHDTGKLFNVLLQRTADHDWTITDIRAL